MTETMQAPAAIKADVVGDDLPCYRCGYNVRGLASDGRCPECAASVGETLHRRAATTLAGGFLPLEMSDPRWVRRLATACTLLLIAGTGLLATHVLSIFELQVPMAVSVPIFLTPCALLVAGVWMLGAGEPTHAGRRRAWLCVTVRVTIVAWLLSMTGMIWVLASAGPFNALRYCMVSKGLTTAAVSWAFFWRLREFAGRLDRRWLRRACAGLAVLVSLLCLASCVPGAGEIEIRPDAYHMFMPEPIFGCSMLLVLLPCSLAYVPRFDAAVAAYAAAALASAGVFVVLDIFHFALHRAARRSRDIVGSVAMPREAPGERTAAGATP